MNKKVKRFIVCSLAAVMILSSVNVMADNAADEKVLTATESLTQLGVLREGDFTSDEISRSEAFCVALRAKNYLTDESFEAAAQQKSLSFKDVDENHPAYGQLTLMEQMGLIKGDGDGNVRPDDAVTYDEMIAFLVRLLGYDKLLDETMGFPVGYMFKASETGIVKGLSCVAGMPVKRDDILIMLNNSLDVPIVVMTAYDAITQQPTYVPSDTRTLAKDIIELSEQQNKNN